MPAKDPSAAIWIAAGLRMEVERLQDASQRADEANLPKISADLADLALELAKIYSQLIELARYTPPSPRRKNATNQPDVPF